MRFVLLWTTNNTAMRRALSIIVMLFFIIHCSLAQQSKKKDDVPPLVDPVTNCQLRYYYFPNIEAYFDAHKNIYYYKEDSEWITADEIPDGYRGYSLYNGVYVYITDYDDDLITQFINIHKKKYPYTKKGNRDIFTKADK